MKIVSIEEIQANIREYLKQSDDQPIVIYENGSPIATITLITDGDDLDSLRLANNPKFNQMMDDARKRIEKTGGIPHENFWKLIDEKYSEFEESTGNEKEIS